MAANLFTANFNILLKDEKELKMLLGWK